VIKGCHNCKHFYTDYEGDYSELTPGSGAEIRCWKNHYYLENSDLVNLTAVRRALRLGETCDDFEPVEESK
jgi:hypothetical protein